MSTSKSLFDRFIEAITYETKFTDTRVFSDEVVCHVSSRAGRKTRMSTHRYLAISSLEPGLRKRYIGPTSTVGALTSVELDNVAKSEFLEDNARCKRFNSQFKLSDQHHYVQVIVGEAKSYIADVLDSMQGSCLTLHAIATRLRTGPGASSNASGDNGAYGRCAEGSMSFSSAHVSRIYKMCMRSTPLGSLVEAVRHVNHGVSDVLNSCALFLSVPKTNLKNRGICTQPSGNMALQLATHGLLATMLKVSFDCDLENQQFLNRRLAQLGSRGQVAFQDQSWEFCTIDLSRASNFPLILLKLLFPKNWVRWLLLIRSPFMEMNGVRHRKHMLSTMGNGTTFSLMTLLLSALVKAVYKVSDLPEYDKYEGTRVKTWAVYGDDIIVDKQVFDQLCWVLEDLGFLLNRKKTFSDGLFKESCGGDYYAGNPVRPVFVETLQTQADIFSLINRLNVWSATHSWPLPLSIALLYQALDEDLRVPNWEDDCAGLHVPYSHMRAKSSSAVPLFIKKRMDAVQVKIAYESLTPLVQQRKLYDMKVQQVSYTETRPLYNVYGVSVGYARGGTVFKYSLTTTRLIEDVCTNEPGVLFFTLSGDIKQGAYGVRTSGTVLYKKKWNFASSWGDPTLYGGTATRISTGTTGVAYKHWEMYVRLNLALKGATPTHIGMLCAV